MSACWGLDRDEIVICIYLIEELGMQSNRKENVLGFVNKSLYLQLESKEEIIWK